MKKCIKGIVIVTTMSMSLSGVAADATQLSSDEVPIVLPNATVGKQYEIQLTADGQKWTKSFDLLSYWYRREANTFTHTGNWEKLNIVVNDFYSSESLDVTLPFTFPVPVGYEAVNSRCVCVGLGVTGGGVGFYDSYFCTTPVDQISECPVWNGLPNPQTLEMDFTYGDTGAWYQHTDSSAGFLIKGRRLYTPSDIVEYSVTFSTNGTIRFAYGECSGAKILSASSPIVFDSSYRGGVEVLTNDIRDIVFIPRSFPAGMTLSKDTGVLSGTPTESGTYVFAVSADGLDHVPDDEPSGVSVYPVDLAYDLHSYKVYTLIVKAEESKTVEEGGLLSYLPNGWAEPIVVSNDWIIGKGISENGGAASDVLSKLGECGKNGIPRYQSYVLGMEPDSHVPANEQLKAVIRGFDADGSPQISYEPTPNVPAHVNAVVLGKAALTEDIPWQTVGKGHERDYNFFKVSVDIK